MNRGAVLTSAIALLAGVILTTVRLRNDATSPSTDDPTAPPRSPAEVRAALFAEVQPVKLANCELERFGEAHDGGYLMCGNLLGEVEAGYSYGINGFDGWGCQISTKLGVRVHQYDCFNTAGAALSRRERGVSCRMRRRLRRHVEDGRPFDTIANQTMANGDGTKRIVLKIDVEGAEWDSFLQTTDDVLRRIDQAGGRVPFRQRRKIHQGHPEAQDALLPGPCALQQLEPPGRISSRFLHMRTRCCS